MFSAFLLGPSTILIEIAESLNTTPSDFSLVFTFFMVGLITGQLTSNIYSRLVSRINLISIVYLALMAVSAGMFFSSNIYVFYLLYFVAGYFLGVSYIKANQYILASPVTNKAKILTIATIFFPFGAILSPMLSVFMVESGWGYRYIYLAYLGMFVFIFLLYQLVTRRRKYNYQELKNSKIMLKDALNDRNKNLLLAAACLAILSYAISETVLSTWAPTFFREVRGLSPLDAGLQLTVFWIVLILGRLVFSQLTEKIKPIYIILILTIGANVSLASLMLANSKASILISAVFTGLSFSAIFPLLVYIGSRIYKQQVDLLLPVLFISGTAGNALAPYLTSMVSRSSINLSIWVGYLFIFITLLLTVFLYVYRRRI
ncbi:MAG: MFS transporter [Actinomycetota bacterium]|nr:MFS transporter [Actinomycetota bacterium]